MEFKTDERGALASRTVTDTGSAHSDELDLFDELAAFSALSPEEQQEELERIESANAVPSVPVDDAPPISFDFIEQSDVPTRAADEFDRSPESLFNLVDKSQFEPVEPRPSWGSAEAVFAFLEDPAEEPSQSSQASHLAPQSDESLRVTSPLEDICSEALLLPQPNMKCDGCGAALAAEDLFCPSCGQLLGEVGS